MSGNAFAATESLTDAIIPGILTRLGYYRDTLPLLIITIPKGLSGNLQLRDGVRVEIPFVVYEERFRAGMRTTSRSATIQICPDLFDERGCMVRLAEIVYKHGLDCCQVVNLSLFESELHCRRGSALDIQHYQDLGWLGRQRESARRLREKRHYL